MFRNNPSKYLIDYIEGQGISLPDGFIDPRFDQKQTAPDPVAPINVN